MFASSSGASQAANLSELLSGAPTLTEGRGAVDACPAQRLIGGRYRPEEVIGVGGMACVYRCHDLFDDVDVAAKRMLVDGTHSRIVEDCFHAERSALSAMNHDNIVTLREHGQDRDGAPYLIMDFVPGVALNRIPTTELPFPLLWLLVDQLLAALVHVHERGVVHGDLTPANVLVEDTELGPRVQLVDFGLCWHFGQPLPARGASEPLSGPPPGCGTLGYMAPEQLRGDVESIGPWTDLYSLGAIAYRLIAGRRPRTSGPRSIRCLLPLESPPVPIPVRSDTPEAVIDFVMDLLELAPERRASSSRRVRAEWQHYRPAGPFSDLSLTRVAMPAQVPSREPTTRVESPKRSDLFPPIAALAGW